MGELKAQGVEAIMVEEESDVSYYHKCSECTACVPLLSRAFVESYWCEGQLTWGIDRQKRMVAVVVDAEGFQSIMSLHGAPSCDREVFELKSMLADLERRLEEAIAGEAAAVEEKNVALA